MANPFIILVNIIINKPSIDCERTGNKSSRVRFKWKLINITSTCQDLFKIRPPCKPAERRKNLSRQIIGEVVDICEVEAENMEPTSVIDPVIA